MTRAVEESPVRASSFNRGLRSSERHDWETPPALFAELNEQFGPFDLDVAASPKNALTQDFFTVETDALTRPWHGTAYCNPPYGRVIGKWVAKAKHEAIAGHAAVVMLLPARTDTAWWHEHVIAGGAEVQFVRGRIYFRIDGQPVGPAPFPSAIVVFRKGARP